MERTGRRARLAVISLAVAALAVLACTSGAMAAIAPEQARAADTKTVSDVYGVTRSELVSWLKSHEKDKYYLTTPYKPYDWRSPKGDINGWGANSDGKTAGMNCTGFVWHALCAAHGWKDDIADNLPALTGWAEAISKNSLETYTYGTKKELLESGKLEKGDVIWMWDGGDTTKISDFHHIAIFWGDKSDEDLMWHSSGDASNNWSGINDITEIHGKASSVSYQIVKLGGKLSGAISLTKVSADESVTKGNAAYNLKGAKYGVFTKKSDAETHKAKEAVKTFTTDAKGTFTSGEEFDAGTYYVAETDPPKGYALDGKVYKVEVEAGKTAKVNGGTVKDTPLLGGVELVKRSANPQITDGNSLYKLEGAVYGMFRERADAETHDASRAAKTYATGADGSLASALEWAAGTYYVAETAAPAGYALDGEVYEVTLEPGEVAKAGPPSGSVSDVPKSNPIGLWAAKYDAETADRGAQGAATLGGALFEIAYYDGYYEPDGLPAIPTRTWNVRTDADGKAYARDDLLVSGDEFYRTVDGRITIPLGTVTAREVAPPRGYLLEDGQRATGELALAHIRGDTADANGEVGLYTAPDVLDYVQCGGVAIGKVDRQNARYLPQGAATLEGATFEIVTDNDQQVLVGGTRYEKGQVVGSIQTELADDGRYIARTPDRLLPVGAYTLREVGTGEGYLLDEVSRAWSRSFTVEEDGQTVDLTDEADCVGNEVARGDFGFSKVDGQTDERLGLIPFMVTSRTTGEGHVIMTDENGMVSTAAGWNAHTERTNANDGAVRAEAGAEGGYVVDEEALDPAAGVWFDGRLDAAVDADDDLGALPYDTYDVSELRVSANAGYELATFTVRVSRHARELDLGTVDDNAGPLIGTTLADGDDVKLATAGTVATLVDEVRYDNLDMREEYTLSGELHLVTKDGEDGGIVDKATVTFKPQGTDGSVDVPFQVDTNALGTARLVAFERLARSDGSVVATHEDLSDEGQTVRVPEIGTTLLDATDGDHEATADEIVTLVDIVSFSGLTPGTTYVMEGALHLRDADGADAGPALDDRGREVTARQTFTPTEARGEVEVALSFSAPNLAGCEVVAFEELTRSGRTYAVHADISDEGQTVRFEQPHVEKGQPPEDVPIEDVPTADVPTAQKTSRGKPAPEKSGLPRTGDLLGPLPLALVAAASLGLALTVRAVRRLQRAREITIRRGPGAR